MGANINKKVIDVREKLFFFIGYLKLYLLQQINTYNYD